MLIVSDLSSMIPNNTAALMLPGYRSINAARNCGGARIYSSMIYPSNRFIIEQRYNVVQQGREYSTFLHWNKRFLFPHMQQSQKVKKLSVSAIAFHIGSVSETRFKFGLIVNSGRRVHNPTRWLPHLHSFELEQIELYARGPVDMDDLRKGI